MIEVAAKTKVTNDMKLVVLQSRLAVGSLLWGEMQRTRVERMSKFMARAQGFINLKDTYQQASRVLPAPAPAPTPITSTSRFASQEVTHGPLIVPGQHGIINPLQGVGHPQAPRSVLSALPPLPAPVVVAVLAPGLGNPYPLGLALPPVDEHVATNSGGLHIVGSTRNSQKRYLRELAGEGVATTFPSRLCSWSEKEAIISPRTDTQAKAEAIWKDFEDDLDPRVGIERVI
uniref:Uncharacterized protein n=1 Tax=Cannabis sativa TaxID=3483 RepID=A0A803PSS4_CANSA